MFTRKIDLNTAGNESSQNWKNVVDLRQTSRRSQLSSGSTSGSGGSRESPSSAALNLSRMPSRARERQSGRRRRDEESKRAPGLYARGRTPSHARGEYQTQNFAMRKSNSLGCVQRIRIVGHFSSTKPRFFRRTSAKCLIWSDAKVCKCCRSAAKRVSLSKNRLRYSRE